MNEEQRNRILFLIGIVGIATGLAVYGAFKKLVLGVPPENEQTIQETVPSVLGLDPMIVSALWPFSLLIVLIILLVYLELDKQLNEAQDRQLDLQTDSENNE